MSPAALLSCPLLVLLPLLSRLLSGFRCSGCCALRMRRAGLGHHHLHHRRQYSWCKVETEGVRLFRVCREFVSESCRSFFFFLWGGGVPSCPAVQTQRGNVRHCARKMRFVCPQSAGTGFTPSWKQFQAFVQSDAEVCVCVRWSRDTDEPLHP